MYLTIKKIDALSELFNYPLEHFQKKNILVTCHYQKQKRYDEIFFSAPRQVGKSHELKFDALIHCLDGARVLYTAQESGTVKKFQAEFIDMCDMLIEMELVKPFKSKNPQVIYFESGGYITFRTRAKKGIARGLTIDVVIYDEAQTVTDSMTSAIEPVLINAFDGKKPGKSFYYGTPPTAADWRLYGLTPFARAKINKVPNYFEISAADEYDSSIPITKKTYFKANPRAKNMSNESIEAVLGKAKVMSHEQFANEYLGIWTFPKEMASIKPALGGKFVSEVLTSRATDKNYFHLSVGIDDQSEMAYIILFDGFTAEAAGKFSTKYGSIAELASAIKEISMRVTKISIPNTFKGRGLKVELEKSIDKKKLTLVSDIQQAYNMEVFIKNVIEKSIRIYDNRIVTNALGSFYTKFDPRKGIAKPEAILPDDNGLVVGFANCVLNDEDSTKLANYNRFGSLVGK